METKITPVEFEMTQTHYYNYISSFPNQRVVEEGKGVLPQKQVILDHLRKELTDIAINPQLVKNKLCYRECFKLNDKDYISFCLEQKCGNPGFMEAAKQLDLVKK